MRATAAILASVALLSVGIVPVSSAEDSTTFVVCQDPDATGGCEYGFVQNAVEDASEGDRIEIRPGVYHQDVTVYEPDGITIAGAGPGETVLDGTQAEQDSHGIYIPGADDVTVRDLTVRNFADGNGIYFSGVTGFHVTDAEAMDNGAYGIYADQSTNGVFEDSHASGHYDAGFYLGNVDHCDCTIRDVVSEDNLIGYSGTSSSDLVIRDSVFRNNAAGVVPNVLDPGANPPSDMLVTGNLFDDNNNEEMSTNHQVAGFYVPEGFGVINAGGMDNVWADNTFVDHERAAFAQIWLFYDPVFNVVQGNTFVTQDVDVEQAGADDLVHEAPVDILWSGGGVDNCFEGNERADGSPVTFDAGPVWNTAGTLPDCDTPNAGAPAPNSLARQLSLMMTRCEPSEHDLSGPGLDEEACDYSALQPT
jgi:parallel beta-helix repeat protein